MFFERIKATIRTLRFRLMLWNALAVLVTGFAILATVRQGVQLRLFHDLDQVLSEDLDEVTLNLREESGLDFNDLQLELDSRARNHTYQQWFVLFLNEQGSSLWKSAGAPQLPPLVVEAGNTGKLTVDEYRLAVRKLSSSRKLPGVQAKLICVGSSIKFIQRDMSSIDRMVGLVAAALLVASPLAGYILAGRATQPLAQMMQTTARLRPAEMEERLKVRGTGDELDQLAVTVNGLLDRLAAYVKQKHDFLANAAHELRTPLSAIRSSVEVALGGDRTVEEYNELLAEVIDECNSLETLVNQLLLLAETDADRQEVTGDRVPLDVVVSRTAEMFQGVAEHQGVRLVVEPLPSVTVLGNRHYLRQVLGNLLDNAIKFTASRYLQPSGPSVSSSNGDRGEIVISLEPNQERQQVRLTIADNGPGISKEDLPLIFDRFYRVDRSRMRGTSTDGTGLGLSICQAIIHAHHGTIECESELDVGTKFVITLNMASHQAEKEAA